MARRDLKFFFGYLLLGGLASGLYSASPQGSDSQQFLLALKDADRKTQTLNKDASELEMLSRTAASERAYADCLNVTKHDVNALAQSVKTLDDLQAVAAPWQKIAIARIRPEFEELINETTRLIRNIAPGRTWSDVQTRKDYIAAYQILAAGLAGITTDFVRYGEAKAKFEALRGHLELEDRIDEAPGRSPTREKFPSTNDLR